VETALLACVIIPYIRKLQPLNRNETHTYWEIYSFNTFVLLILFLFRQSNTVQQKQASARRSTGRVDDKFHTGQLQRWWSGFQVKKKKSSDSLTCLILGRPDKNCHLELWWRGGRAWDLNF
jgi:hypothetical protein